MSCNMEALENRYNTEIWGLGDKLLLSLDELKAFKEKGDGVRVSLNDIDMDKFEENPKGYIQELYAKREKMTPSLPLAVWESQTLEALHLKYLQRRLENSSTGKIPSLNDHDTVRVQNGQLVRFRCMIQDHCGTEYGACQHSVTNPITGEVKTGSTLLQDCMEMNEEELPTLVEKDLFIAISPPGENFWVSQETVKDSESGLEKKRSKLDQAEEGGNFISLPNYKDIVPTLFGNIGDAKPTACLLKMYKYDDYDWKHNDLLEVAGLIEIPTGEIQPAEESDGIIYPELGKLPVLHVFSCLKLANGNPNIPLLEEKMFPMFPLSDVPASDCAQALRELLALGLGGDRYAAVYAMIALVARVDYLEKQSAEIGTLGKVVLNISGISESSDIPDLLMYIIKALVPRTVNLDFGIENMNTVKLIPNKNLNTNQLEPGFFQLPVGTQLIVNEIALQEGNFNDYGVRNVMALKHLLQEQKVKYDYTYQYPEIEANFPVIILSKTKSVLPFDTRIEIKPDTNLTLEEKRSRIEQILNEKGEMLRNYLTMLRMIKLPMRLFDYTDESLMNDLVEYLGQRNNSPLFHTKMSGEEYSAFITSCRSWCMFHGRGHITRDGFMFWKELERIRDSRFARLSR